MKIVTFLCAKNVVIDQFTNQVSVFSLYERIALLAFPAMQAQFSVLIAVKKEKHDADNITARLKISVDEDVIFDNPAEISFNGADGTRCLITLPAIPIPHPGSLNVTLYRNKKILATLSIDAVQINPIEANSPKKTTAKK
jgi:hypothetical protein